LSEPLWCEVRGHYCRCQDFGKRCDDFDEDETVPSRESVVKALEAMGVVDPEPSPNAAVGSQAK
jgi:hypothetical protein